MSASPFPIAAYFFKRYKKQTVFVILALLMSAAVEIVGIGALFPLLAIIIGQPAGVAANDGVLNRFVEQGFALFSLEPTLGALLSLIIVAISLKAVITYYCLKYVGYVAADIARDFQLRLIWSLMSAQWQYFTGLSSGAVSNAVASESQRAGYCYMLACRALAALFQIIVYLTAAFFVSWKLSFYAIIVGVVFGFLVKNLMNSARNSGRLLSQTSDRLMSDLGESLSAAKPLKAMAEEDRFCDQLDRQSGEVVGARKSLYASAHLLQIVYEPLLVISLSLGLYLILTYTTTPMAQVILLAFLFQRLMGYVNQAQNHYQYMLQNESAIWTIEAQISKAQEFVEKPSHGSTPVFDRQIEVVNSDIAYANGKKVFQNFSCVIPASKLTVLFGHSGTGKTTLTDAILGLIPLQAGEIRIDGAPMTSLNTREWRKMCGYVPQDNFLFHDTVRQNITLGDARYSEADVWHALEQAAAKDFVQALPGGLESVVGERGGKLSGGQRQRIILARALVRNPKLLLLDEPTSALDKENEKVIFSVLKGLARTIAIVLITHNRDALAIADHTIMLGANNTQVNDEYVGQNRA